MGVKIFIFIVVPYVLAAGCVSFCLWDWLSRGEPSVSSTIRNLVLIWGAPLATGLAVWRSMVAQKQAETAQKGWLSDRYQRAVEMLGHDLDFIHVGGIYILRDIALEHPDEYWREVDALLKIYDLVQLQATYLGIAIPSPFWGEGKGEGNGMRFQPPLPPSSPASGRGGKADSQRG